MQYLILQGQAMNLMETVMLRVLLLFLLWSTACGVWSNMTFLLIRYNIASLLYCFEFGNRDVYCFWRLKSKVVGGFKLVKF